MFAVAVVEAPVASADPITTHESAGLAAPIAADPVAAAGPSCLPQGPIQSFDDAFAHALAVIEARGLRVVDLKQELSKLGLSQTGLKAELVHRLATAQAKAATAPAVIPSTTAVEHAPSASNLDDTDESEFKDAVALVDMPRGSKPPAASRRPPAAKSKRAHASSTTVAEAPLKKAVTIEQPEVPAASESTIIDLCDVSTSCDGPASPVDMSAPAEQSVSDTPSQRVKLLPQSLESFEEATATRIQDSADQLAAQAEAEALLAREAAEAMQKEEAEKAARLELVHAAEEAERQRQAAADAAAAAEAEAARWRAMALEQQQAREAEQARAAEAEKLLAETRRQEEAAAKAKQRDAEAAKREADRQQMKALAENVQRLAEMRRKREEEKKTAATPGPAMLAPPLIKPVSLLSVATPLASLTVSTIGMKVPPLPPSPKRVTTSHQPCPPAVAPPKTPGVTTPASLLTVQTTPQTVDGVPSNVSLQWMELARAKQPSSASSAVSLALSIATPSPMLSTSTDKENVSTLIHSTGTVIKEHVAITPVTPFTATPARASVSSATSGYTVPPQHKREEVEAAVTIHAEIATNAAPIAPVPTSATVLATAALVQPVAEATSTAPQQSAVAMDYEMSDGEVCSEDEDETPKGPVKNIPSWARGEELEAALKRQFGGATIINPDDIFGDVPPCDLEGTRL